MSVFAGSPTALASESEYDICGAWVALVQLCAKHFPTWEYSAVQIPFSPVSWLLTGEGFPKTLDWSLSNGKGQRFSSVPSLSLLCFVHFNILGIGQAAEDKVKGKREVGPLPSPVL